MTERKSLLKRYGIPLNHLDFDYVKECNDAREMEKIFHILQSGEEGYFPDLTKCAEDKLRLLKPNSRLFRCEVQLVRRDDVSESDLQPIKEFSRTVRDRDQRLAAFKDDNDSLAPIRNAGKINLNGKDPSDENSGNKNADDSKNTSNPNSNPSKRISSTDYRKWDRYDPDEEILRMDLAEEREQEEIERKNRLNMKKKQQTPLIEEIKEEQDRLKKLTDIERDSLAEEYRLRGNEYFRAKEYDSALVEYTRTILLNPEKDAAAYNNRAITYIKLKKFSDAIRDCTKCLSIDPNNIKAMYRLAQSNMECGFKEKALEMFLKVLELDPTHTNAKNFANTLCTQIGESPPTNATRLHIEEGPNQSKSPTKNIKKTSKISNQKETKKKTESKSAAVTKEKDYDLASLVRPKEIVPNKWVDTAANMIGKTNYHTETDSSSLSDNIKTSKPLIDEDDKEIKIRLPMLNETVNTKNNKPLIEEL